MMVDSFTAEMWTSSQGKSGNIEMSPTSSVTYQRLPANQATSYESIASHIATIINIHLNDGQIERLGQAIQRSLYATATRISGHPMVVKADVVTDLIEVELPPALEDIRRGSAGTNVLYVQLTAHFRNFQGA